MHHRVPVVAYGVTAVPETVLDAGVVLPSKSPVLVAIAVQRVLSDIEFREGLVAKGSSVPGLSAQVSTERGPGDEVLTPVERGAQEP